MHIVHVGLEGGEAVPVGEFGSALLHSDFLDIFFFVALLTPVLDGLDRLLSFLH